MPFTTIDLCAGIGGIRKGFELTGEYVNILSAEIDKYACKMYEHLYGDNPYNDLTSDEFKKRVENINYDILLAGFPCQSFSRAGLQMGFCDQDKGIIFSHIADIISRTRPKAIFLENVVNTMERILCEIQKILEYRKIGLEHTLWLLIEEDMVKMLIC